MVEYSLNFTHSCGTYVSHRRCASHTLTLSFIIIFTVPQRFIGQSNGCWTWCSMCRAWQSTVQLSTERCFCCGCTERNLFYVVMNDGHLKFIYTYIYISVRTAQ